MNLACPNCDTVYRLDPARVPATGALTRCRECEATFRVPAEAPAAPGTVVTATAAPVGTAEPATEPAAPAGEPARPPAEPREESVEPAGEEQPAAAPPAFGPQDPDTRARRLARALVSDIKVYNPEKWEKSREEGTLRAEFRDEILKSWEEYVEQVGQQMAKGTPFFQDALNEILAEGERVF